MKSKRSSFVGLVVLLSVWMQTSAVAAQEQAAAEALFRSAREAADRGDWVTACDRFEESLRLEPAPGTVLNLAKCREELGQVASAWKRYGEVVQRLPKTDPRVTYAREREKALESVVPELVLSAPESDVALTVTVNEMVVTRAMFDVPLPLDPGAVRIVVKAEGHEDWSREIAIERGGRVELRLELGAAKSEAREALVDPRVAGDRVDDADGSSRRTWGFIALGVGSVGAIAGASGFIWAALENDTVQANCRGASCLEAGFDASQRGQTAVALGFVGLGVGVLGLGVGTYLLATDGGSSVAVSARALPGGAGLTLGGTL